MHRRERGGRAARFERDRLKDDAPDPGTKPEGGVGVALARTRRALGIAWDGARGLLVGNAVLVFVQGLLPLLGLYLTKCLIDAVAHGLVAEDRAAAFGHVVDLVVLAALAALLGTVASAIGAYASQSTTQRISYHGVKLLQRKAMQLDLQDLEDPKCQDLLHRAQSEAAFRPAQITDGLVSAAERIVSLLAMTGLLGILHPVLALVVVAAVVPGAFLRARVAQRYFAWAKERTPEERRAWYLSWLLTGGAPKEVRLFGLGPMLADRFDEIRRRLDRERLGFSVKRSGATALEETLGAVVLFGAYAWLGYRAIHGAISIGDLVMYGQAVQRAQGALQGLVRSFARLHEDQLNLVNFFDFLDLPPRVPVPAAPQALPPALRAGFLLEGVTFIYPGASKPVLEDLDLEIRPGEHVALVGHNGAGKSTLLKLLCRFYDPTRGRILLDGKDLRDLAPAELRERIAALFQDFVRYDFSAAENIRVGDPGVDAGNRERIAEAARRAGADQVIEGLPQGYDTMLGRRFTGGSELSVGQWQQIALARAFLRDAPIVLLDEPASSLDARVEAELFERIRELLRGRLAVLVSHRFSTVRLADRILVLDKGRIVETGSHAELVRTGGLYARLFEAQARHYR